MMTILLITVTFFYAFFSFWVTDRVAISEPKISLRAEQASDVEPPSKGGILFISNSSPDYYSTRVKEIRETWGKWVSESELMHLIFVTNPNPDITLVEGDDVRFTECPKSYKDIPECCKRGDMYLMAWDYLNSKEGANKDWVAFIDDDVYILPNVLLRYLNALGDEGLNSLKLYGLTMASPRCKSLWGGTGYIANRKTLELIVKGNSGYYSVREEIMASCSFCGSWGDITATWVPLNKRDNLITNSDSFFKGKAHMYNKPRDELESILAPGRKVDPWMFHHSSRGNMYWIHQKVVEYGINTL